MANISQHEAAELWEIARDHFTTREVILLPTCPRPQLRATIEQHACCL